MRNYLTTAIGCHWRLARQCLRFLRFDSPKTLAGKPPVAPTPLVTGLIVLLLLAAAPATRPADPALDAKLAEVDRRASAVKELTADFVQTKKSPLLREPLVSRGTVAARPSVMVWRAEKPEPTVTRVDAAEVQIYYPKRRVLEVYAVAGRAGSLTASPLPRLAALRASFAIAADAGAGLDAAKDADALALRLEPTDDELKQYVDHVRVLLDARRGLVRTFEITDPDGEVTTVRFDAVNTNPKLGPAAFEVNAAPGTKVVRPAG